MKTILASVLGLCVMVGPALAAAQKYEVMMHQMAPGEWHLITKDSIAIGFNAARGAVFEVHEGEPVYVLSMKDDMVFLRSDRGWFPFRVEERNAISAETYPCHLYKILTHYEMDDCGLGENK